MLQNDSTYFGRVGAVFNLYDMFKKGDIVESKYKEHDNFMHVEVTENGSYTKFEGIVVDCSIKEDIGRSIKGFHTSDFQLKKATGISIYDQVIKAINKKYNI